MEDTSITFEQNSVSRDNKRRTKLDIKKVINDWQKIPSSSSVPLLLTSDNSQNIDYYDLIKVQISKDCDQIELDYQLIMTKDVPTGLTVLGPSHSVYRIQSAIGPYKKIFWRFIRLTNPFELVNSGKGRHSVIAINTINRAYFKMIEILKNFNLIDNNKPLTYAALAEGPGGFIQAVSDYRKNNEDIIWGITIKNDRESSTKWNHSLNSKFKICYGDSKINDGNLLNPLNIKAYTNLFKDNKADLVTADGGFFVPSKLENFKEQIHLHLFLCEIVTALKVQKIGGNFILKIYDIFTNSTVQLLSILASGYEQVFITKPVTSRPANSEKYIVCMNYRGINNLDKLFEICEKLWKYKQKNIYISSLFSNTVPRSIIEASIDINKILLGYKIRHIQTTLQLTRRFTDNGQKNDEFRRIQASALIKQKKIARDWANKYDIPIKK